MDILTAQHLVKGTEECLRKCSRDFDGVKKAADEFVAWANGILQEQDECDLEVQTALPEKTNSYSVDMQPMQCCALTLPVWIPNTSLK
ncbi:hypothetical protein JOQ06_014034 [Pogonophryne albipinna]|uniref:Uncharacterized protein n=1 Tax=Pogonophryne albipinna TaxID=1090488 RepID=A0AAD6F7E3_9TELE|nr:hypothetical protein JOQ06_014034 [Pogonophryne albipinna]